MSEHLKIALTQLSPELDVDTNVAAAVDVVKASGPSADLVLLPENCLALGTNAQMRERALSLDSPAIQALQGAADEVGAAVVLGGFKRDTGDPLVRNSALVIAGDGRIVGTYDKIHLFDAVLGDRVQRASDVEAPGDHPVMLHVGDVPVGMTICFDVRFPSLHRRLAQAGAKVLLVPAAFAARTGPAHWEVLLRARAIENEAFVVASATYGPDNPGFPSYGHAVAIDPWGEVLTDLGEERSAWQVVDLEFGVVDDMRHSLPVLGAGKPQAYSAPIEVLDTNPQAKTSTVQGAER